MTRAELDRRYRVRHRANDTVLLAADRRAANIARRQAALRMTIGR